MMSNRIQVSEDVFVGPQPGEDELQQLAKDQFTTVVNLRTYDEEDEPFSPGDEGVRVRQLGMEYLSIPISKDDLSVHQVDDFRTKLRLVGKPVYVHCSSGKRAGAMVMMDLAAEKGLSGDETLQQAAEMGFECDVPELKQFVTAYVDEKRQAAE